MRAHLVDLLDMRPRTMPVEREAADILRGAGLVNEYRWMCSCGRSGTWKPSALNARYGGARHVAAMERGR